MTDDSKNNLLKLLMNKQDGTPGDENLELNKKATNLDLINFSGATFEYNNITIAIDNNNYTIKLYDKDENLLHEQYIQINGQNVSGTWTIDEEGDIYGAHYYNNKWYLAYWNNPTIKVNGHYEFKVKRTYDIDSIIHEATIRSGSTFQFSGGTLAGIKKSPFDGRFVIFATAFAGNIRDMYNFSAILYQVNVGSTNTYSFVHSTSGDDNLILRDSYVEWTNNNCKFTCAVEGRDQLLSQTTYNMHLWEYTGQVNSGTISATSWSVTSARNINYKYIDSTHGYAITQTIPSTTFITRLYYVNNGTRSIIRTLETTPASYTLENPILYTTGYVYDNFYPFVTPNGEIFFMQYKTKTTGQYLEDIVYSTQFLHVKDGVIQSEYSLEDTYMALTLGLYIKTDFNLYTLYSKQYTQKSVPENYKILFVYNQDSYNGTPYINNQSLMGAGGIIKKNSTPIFARDLYNAEQINNQITNIIQIPNYYLNNENNITQELISRTNTKISDTEIVIDKNQYEQVFLSWIEQIRVLDNNNGSIYNQQATYKVAEQIFDGFEDNYKITNYRLNYADETHTDNSLTTEIVNNIGIITIEVEIQTNYELDNIELYDSNYTIPFLKIDTSKLKIGNYTIKQYLKIE